MSTVTTYFSGIGSKDILMLDGEKKKKPFEVIIVKEGRTTRTTISFYNKEKKVKVVSASGKVINKKDHREFIYHSTNELL